MKLTTYENLPDRTILKNPFVDKPLISYGIVAYCTDTQHWLLVRRRYSPEFIIIIRGSYRLSEARRLLIGCSKEELIKIQRLIDDQICFSTVFRETISNNLRDLEYSFTRFLEAKKTYIELLPSIVGETNTEWLWPKGRLHVNRETPYNCAVREFCEETGINLNHVSDAAEESPHAPYPVCMKSITESFRGSNGRVYETRCWVYIFPKEIAIPPIQDLSTPGEIGECRWVSEREAADLLKPNKFQVLIDAQMLIENSKTKSRSWIKDKTQPENPTPEKTQDNEWTVILRK